MDQSDLVGTIVSALGVVGASFVSGWFLLRSHHSKVKQEIEIHRENELFDRKQKIYWSMLRLVSEFVDYSTNLGKNLNWRIGRDIYNEMILTGSNSVIDAFNKFIKEWDAADETKKTVLLKSIWIAVRKDLYIENLSPEQIKIFNPSKATMDGFEKYGKYRDKLRPLGIEDYESLAQMNIDDIHSKTDIDKDELQVMKKVGLQEVSIVKEWKDFVEKYS